MLGGVSFSCRNIRLPLAIKRVAFWEWGLVKMIWSHFALAWIFYVVVEFGLRFATLALVKNDALKIRPRWCMWDICAIFVSPDWAIVRFMKGGISGSKDSAVVRGSFIRANNLINLFVSLFFLLAAVHAKYVGLVFPGLVLGGLFLALLVAQCGDNAGVRG